MLTLGHFLEVFTNYEATGDEPEITAVVVDSREAQPGSLFVAFAGTQVDGHDYVSHAFAQGAIAAIVEKPISGEHAIVDTREGDDIESSVSTPVCLVVDDTMAALQASAKVWRTRFSPRVIGITGSVGKTSTKELMYSVLSQKYRTLRSPGNRNNEIGLPLTLLELNESHKCVVLEMGMYAIGEIELLCDLAQPDVGVLTIIGPVHLERLGSMEAIVQAKGELVEALPVGGTAVLNRDDDRVMGLADRTKAEIFTYGLDSRADLWADNIRSMGLDGIRFTMHYQGDSWTVNLPLLGRHAVHMALRATAVGLIEGLSWEEIVAGLSTSSAQLRLVVVRGPQGSFIVDDTYNSSPDSAMAALNLLQDLDGRRIAVLGDMLELGHMEEASHRLVGRRVAEVADVLVTLGERARWIAEEAIEARMAPTRVFMMDDAETAVSKLNEIIEKEDLILVKGSLGMRMDRIVAGLGSR